MALRDIAARWRQKRIARHRKQWPLKLGVAAWRRNQLAKKKKAAYGSISGNGWHGGIRVIVTLWYSPPFLDLLRRGRFEIAKQRR